MRFVSEPQPGGGGEARQLPPRVHDGPAPHSAFRARWWAARGF